MKIAIILEHYPKLSETFVLNELYCLQKLGVKGKIFALEKPNEKLRHPIYQQVNFPVFYFPRKVLGSSFDEIIKTHLALFVSSPFVYLKTILWAIMRRNKRVLGIFLRSGLVAQELQRERNNLLYAHFASDSTLMALLLSRLTDIPFGFVIHGCDFFVNPYLLKEKLQEAKFVIMKSDDWRKKLLRRFPEIDEEKVFVVRCGVDLDFFSPEEVKKRKTFTIISVARLAEQKGLKYLIKACHLLKQKRIRFQALIIGDGPLRKNLRRAITEYRLEKNVKILGGKAHTLRFKKILLPSHVFVLPCVVARDGGRDSIPNSMLEAMALRLPVLSTNFKSIREAIKPNKNGFLVPIKDSSSIAEVLIKIRKLKGSEIESYTRSAREKIVRDFDLQKQTEKLLVLFESFC